MFAIHFMPQHRLGANGERFGEIVVEDFRECFACHFAGTVPSLELNWRANLTAIIHGAPVALLQYDHRFAWVVYREGDECVVQQRFSRDGTFAALLPRDVTTVEGEVISTWVTSIDTVQQFLEASVNVGFRSPTT